MQKLRTGDEETPPGSKLLARICPPRPIHLCRRVPAVISNRGGQLNGEVKVRFGPSGFVYGRLLSDMGVVSIASLTGCAAIR